MFLAFDNWEMYASRLVTLYQQIPEPLGTSRDTAPPMNRDQEAYVHAHR